MSIAAVARHAGVSVATVSRVLNDVDNVRAKTVEQVRAAMLEIGYTPPRVKRGPKNGRRRVIQPGMRTGRIAVLNVGGDWRWLGLPIMACVVQGVMRAAKQLDITPVLDEISDDEDVSPIIRRSEVDGAVVFFLNRPTDDCVRRLRDRLPIVWVMGGLSGTLNVDHVTPDNFGVGQLALEYLQAQGCRRLAFVDDRPGWQIMRMRGQSFASAAVDADVDLRHYLVGAVRPVDLYGRNVVTADTLELLVDQIVHDPQRPDGLFVSHDRLTAELYPLLARRGIRPEQDIRIISCDNEHQRLASLSPQPPSIDLQCDELGQWAVRQLIHRLQHPDAPPARIQVMPTLPRPRSFG
jgi:LacI family transcriptional regulator